MSPPKPSGCLSSAALEGRIFRYAERAPTSYCSTPKFHVCYGWCVVTEEAAFTISNCRITVTTSFQAQSTCVPTPLRSWQISPSRGFCSASAPQNELRPSSSISGNNKTTRLFRRRMERADVSSMFEGASSKSGVLSLGREPFTASPARTKQSATTPAPVSQTIFEPLSSARAQERSRKFRKVPTPVLVEEPRADKSPPASPTEQAGSKLE